jgi:hypothetical protein
VPHLSRIKAVALFLTVLSVSTHPPFLNTSTMVHFNFSLVALLALLNLVASSALVKRTDRAVYNSGATWSNSVYTLSDVTSKRGANTKGVKILQLDQQVNKDMYNFTFIIYWDGKISISTGGPNSLWRQFRYDVETTKGLHFYYWSEYQPGVECSGTTTTYSMDTIKSVTITYRM